MKMPQAKNSFQLEATLGLTQVKSFMSSLSRKKENKPKISEKPSKRVKTAKEDGGACRRL